MGKCLLTTIVTILSSFSIYFIEYLLSFRVCVRCWRYNTNMADKFLWELTVLYKGAE